MEQVNGHVEGWARVTNNGTSKAHFQIQVNPEFDPIKFGTYTECVIMTKERYSELVGDGTALRAETIQIMSDPEAHYTTKANAIKAYKLRTRASEREMSALFGISKTEVNRMMDIASWDTNTQNRLKKFKTEKWVMWDVQHIYFDQTRWKALDLVLEGQITTRKQLKDFVKAADTKKRR